MQLNKPALHQLMKDRFNGKYSRLAKAIGVDTSYVYRVMANEKSCGVKFYSGIINWCNENDVDYEDYIFLR